MAGGRPPKYKTPEDMYLVIDAYFENCDSNNKPYTIAGLALALDMSTQALRDYQEKDQFLGIIKKAKQRVENSFEERLTGGSAAGSIFWLKNHAGYKDKQEIEQSGEVIHKIERVIVKPN